MKLLFHSASVESVKFEACEAFEARELAFANDCFKHERNEEIGVLYQVLYNVLFMRQIVIIFILVISGNLLFSQSEKQSIEQIRNHFKWINQQQDFVIAELNNLDYLKHTPDNGAQIKGYFKNDTLYKLVEWIGLSEEAIVTEYYLWNEKLIFVYKVGKQYRTMYDDQGNMIGYDYSKLDIKYEIRYYFEDGKEIKRLSKGERLTGNSRDENFDSNLQSYLPLLKNKLKYQKEYDQLQGLWISTTDSLSVIEFDGLSKIEYYEEEFMDQSKIKIEDKYLYCWILGENEKYKYEIMNMTDRNLTLLYLPVGRLLTYEKNNTNRK